MTLPTSTTPPPLDEYFRAVFLAELPELLAQCQRLLDDIARTATPQPLMRDLFLLANNIKGSGATFGLPILSAVCLPWQDLIKSCDRGQCHIARFTTLSRGYLDALHIALREITEGKDHYPYTEQKLAELHAQTFAMRFSVALAVNSRMLRELCLHTLVQRISDAHIVVTEDSLSLLQRLLGEPFHLLIVSSESYPLSGEALIAALRCSHHGIMRQAHCVLISSTEKKLRFIKRETDPDDVILRDRHFTARLDAIIERVHTRLVSARTP